MRNPKIAREYFELLSELCVYCKPEVRIHVGVCDHLLARLPFNMHMFHPTLNRFRNRFVLPITFSIVSSQIQGSGKDSNSHVSSSFDLEDDDINAVCLLEDYNARCSNLNYFNRVIVASFAGYHDKILIQTKD